ncbi:MAG: (2Fe-2S) ferredoxin domain-containing protein [Deltaproteobacteria bacterium]|nr:(2Fe-2S) ferredoxin domain-containing protein [Deltaproteobacteria bacterium]
MHKLGKNDLIEIREKYKAVFGLKEGGFRAKITIHMGPCGIAAGAWRVMTALRDEMARAQVTDVLVAKSSCGGLCAREPLATVELINHPPVKYGDLNGKKIRKIFREHVIEGRPIERYALAVGCERTH